MPPGQRSAHVVFVGNLGYFPNVDAALWFAQETLPLLARPTHLELVGMRPAPVLQRLAATNDRVHLVGPVAEVQTHYSRAAVAIAPLRSGSGQQLKILEAMAMGTPVVATSMASAGIDALPGEHLLVADQPADLARQIERLLRSPSLAASLAYAARALIERRYSWEASALALERLWLQAAASER